MCVFVCVCVGMCVFMEGVNSSTLNTTLISDLANTPRHLMCIGKYSATRQPLTYTLNPRPCTLNLKLETWTLNKSLVWLCDTHLWCKSDIILMIPFCDINLISIPISKLETSRLNTTLISDLANTALTPQPYHHSPHIAVHTSDLANTARDLNGIIIHPTQSIIYVPFLMAVFQDLFLLIVQYKCTKSCAEDEMLQDLASSTTYMAASCALHVQHIQD